MLRLIEHAVARPQIKFCRTSAPIVTNGRLDVLCTEHNWPRFLSTTRVGFYVQAAILTRLSAVDDPLRRATTFHCPVIEAGHPHLRQYDPDSARLSYNYRSREDASALSEAPAHGLCQRSNATAIHGQRFDIVWLGALVWPRQAHLEEDCVGAFPMAPCQW